jgi:hypothetical protein
MKRILTETVSQKRKPNALGDFSVGESDDGTPYLSAWYIDPSIDTKSEIQVILLPDGDYNAMTSDGSAINEQDLSMDITLDMFPPEMQQIMRDAERLL